MTSTTQKTSLIRRPGTWLLAGVMAVGLALTGCNKSTGPSGSNCPGGHDSLCVPLSVMIDSGAVIFQSSCTGCHGLDAEGHAGANPPLANSDYFMANKRKTIEIVLAGYSDSIFVNGIWYMGDMPSFDYESDFAIASMLSYLRAVRNDSTVVKCPPDGVPAYDPENEESFDEHGFAYCQKTPRTLAERNSDTVAVWEVKAVRDSLIDAGVLEAFTWE